MSKLKIWHQGEQSEALCPTCKVWRETTFWYRPFLLEKSGIEVPDVLVGVCSECKEAIDLPHQSTPKLKEALRKEPCRVDARIPKELRDVIGVLATDFGGEPEPFAGGVLRYYMREMTDDPALAKRIGMLSTSGDAGGTPGGRLAFRMDKRLLDKALASLHGAKPGDKSALVRGIIVAAKHDAYDKPNKARLSALRAIAAAATV
ncbi:MAG: hypothetical protein V4550_11640 [Gemmatimonadota bacterium]